MAATNRLSGRALDALLPPLAGAPGSRYAALARSIAALVLDGRIAPATRLPSERELAATLHLSRATVSAAYDTLRAEGFLTSRTGSGSVTALPPAAVVGNGSARWRPPPGSLRSTPVIRADAEDAIDLSNAAFTAPAELGDAVSRAAARLPLHAQGRGYEPMGIGDLRTLIAERYTARGAPTDPAQILVTNGALHGIDLVLRLLVHPGDRVLTELPSYSGLLDAIRANSARIVAVPVIPGGGWQVAGMVSALRQTSPRLAALMPDFHNPTGFLAPDADRSEFLQAARRAGTTVLVDESFVDLGFVAPATPAAALDPAVITVGSLSKPIWGGLRVGWIRAAAETIQRLAVVRAAIDMGQSILEQLVAVELMAHYPTITARRRAQVLPQRDALLAALAAQLPGWRTNVPDGGLSLWVELDAPLATPLSLRAGQYGVQVVAGSRFGVDGTMERFLRLPYALPPDRLEQAVDRLAMAWRDLDGSATGYSPLIVA